MTFIAQHIFYHLLTVKKAFKSICLRMFLCCFSKNIDFQFDCRRRRCVRGKCQKQREKKLPFQCRKNWHSYVMQWILLRHRKTIGKIEFRLLSGTNVQPFACIHISQFRKQDWYIDLLVSNRIILYILNTENSFRTMISSAIQIIFNTRCVFNGQLSFDRL